MKSKNVIVLLLSLTLSLVANSRPEPINRDVGLPSMVDWGNEVPNMVMSIVSDSNMYTLQNHAVLYEPVLVVRTSEVITIVNVKEVEVRVMILSKCRDVDLRSEININYINISASTTARSQTAYLHDDGGGGPGRPA